MTGLAVASEPVVEVLAEMVASVLAVEVRPGQVVAEGDVLVVVESMKMEIPVLAPATGTVAEVRVAPGDVAEEGDVLAVVDATADPVAPVRGPA